MHGHQSLTQALVAEKIVNSIQAKARDTIRPIPAVYHEEIQAIATRPDNEEIAAKLPTLTQLKSSLYRNRRSRLPCTSASSGGWLWVSFCDMISS